MCRVILIFFEPFFDPQNTKKNCEHRYQKEHWNYCHFIQRSEYNSRYSWNYQLKLPHYYYKQNIKQRQNAD